MAKYDYLANETKDVLNYINENLDNDQKLDLMQANIDNGCSSIVNDLYDLLWHSDIVTGTSSETYTNDRAKAKEYLAGNLSLLVDALENVGDKPMKLYLQNPEAADVLIRCYLLPSAIKNAIKQLKKTKRQASNPNNKTISKWRNLINQSY